MPDRLIDVINAHDLFLVDLWGVVWLGADCIPIPGAEVLVKTLQDSGKQFYFLSNTVWPQQNLADSMARLGATVTPDRFITSGRVVRDSLTALAGAPAGRRFLHIGRPWEIEGYFSSLTLTDRPEETDVLLLGDFWGSAAKPPTDQLRTIEAVLAGREHVTAIVCNPDRKNIQPDGTFRFQSGHYMLEMQKSFPMHTYIFVGKPHLPIYEYAFALVPGIARERTAMIGDTIATDMEGAANAGIRKVLVTCGNTTAVPEGYHVDYVVDQYTP